MVKQLVDQKSVNDQLKVSFRSDPLAYQRRSHQLCGPPKKLMLTSLNILRRSHQQATPTLDCPHRPQEESPTLPPAWEWVPALPALLPGWGGLMLPVWEWTPQSHAGEVTNYADCCRCWGWLPSEPWRGVTRVGTVKNQLFQDHHTLPT